MPPERIDRLHDAPMSDEMKNILVWAYQHDPIGGRFTTADVYRWTLEFANGQRADHRGQFITSKGEDHAA